MWLPITLLLGVTVTGSILNIIIPILTTQYESLYYILFVTSIEFLIIFGFLLLIFKKGKSLNPPKKIIIFFSGLFNALMGIFGVYTSNPDRTPIVMQTIITGLAIIPSVILTKFLLKKK